MIAPNSKLWPEPTSLVSVAGGASLASENWPTCVIALLPESRTKLVYGSQQQSPLTLTQMPASFEPSKVSISLRVIVHVQEWVVAHPCLHGVTAP